MTDTVTIDALYVVPPADGSKPYIHINADPATGRTRQNYTQEHYAVDIENLRGRRIPYA